MKRPLTAARRLLVNTARARMASLAGRFSNREGEIADRREAVLDLLAGNKRQDYCPAGFFIHFSPLHRWGKAAISKHLQYFRYTDMDFLKVQFESGFPYLPEIKTPDDWERLPRYGKNFFEKQLNVVEGLVKEAKKEAPIIVTLYSPFQCAGHISSMSRAPRSDELLSQHLQEDPDKVKKGLEIVTEGLLTYVRECVSLGVDGFLASTQGGEGFRFRDKRIFQDCIKPFDLQIMEEINRTCDCNILHICDYHGDYDDLTPFLDYPGHVVNCSLRIGGSTASPTEAAEMFDRPFMGGIDRTGLINTGNQRQVAEHVAEILDDAPEKFILGASCTLSSVINWKNIKTAVDLAHGIQI